jgi:hypothetical protein
VTTVTKFSLKKLSPNLSIVYPQCVEGNHIKSPDEEYCINVKNIIIKQTESGVHSMNHTPVCHRPDEA